MWVRPKKWEAEESNKRNNIVRETKVRNCVTYAPCQRLGPGKHNIGWECVRDGKYLREWMYEWMRVSGNESQCLKIKNKQMQETWNKYKTAGTIQHGRQHLWKRNTVDGLVEDLSVVWDLPGQHFLRWGSVPRWCKGKPGRSASCSAYSICQSLWSVGKRYLEVCDRLWRGQMSKQQETVGKHRQRSGICPLRQRCSGSSCCCNSLWCRCGASTVPRSCTGASHTAPYCDPCTDSVWSSLCSRRTAQPEEDRSTVSKSTARLQHQAEHGSTLASKRYR